MITVYLPPVVHVMQMHGLRINLLRISRWRHQMETFSALLAICAGNSPVTGEFPTQRPVTRRFDVFFDQRLSKQWWGGWFETPWGPLWRHCNVINTKWHSRVSPWGRIITNPGYFVEGMPHWNSNLNTLIHWCWDIITAILQTVFSNHLISQCWFE